jgi:hypothetical protein
MKQHIGYTSEKFTVNIDETRIFKYTNDFNRIEFLKTQMNHLKRIGEKYPSTVPSDIEWEEMNNAWGYSMEYIKDANRINDSNLKDVIILIDHCSKIYPTESIPDFITFHNYIKEVITKNIDLYETEDVAYLTEFLINFQRLTPHFNDEKSSCHGDFTMENILVQGNRIILIDPIQKTNQWSSWLQDIAKFYQNIYFSDVPKTLLFTEKIDLIAAGKAIPLYSMIHMLMITNYIRMFPYIKDKPLIFKERYNEFKILINK